MFGRIVPDFAIYQKRDIYSRDRGRKTRRKKDVSRGRAVFLINRYGMKNSFINRDQLILLDAIIRELDYLRAAIENFLPPWKWILHRGWIFGQRKLRINLRNLRFTFHRSSIRARTFISDIIDAIFVIVFIAGKCLIPIIVELTRRYVNRVIEKLVVATA